MARVVRHDRGELSKPVKTPQGLRVEGYAGRAGVYRYDDANGGTRLELRPESEVMHADALAGFEAAPFTNGHPGALISTDPTLRAQHAKGVVLSARRDGEKVAIAATITDPDTVAAIEGGKRELSPGYTVEIDETPGIDPKYGRYDAIQRHIRIDHLALVTKARGGQGMALRMDGERAVHIDAMKCAYADAEGMGGVDGCDGKESGESWGDDDERNDAELTAQARENLGGRKFAVPGKRKLPIHDAPHIRAAMSRFAQTEGLSSDEKSAAAHKIVNAAKAHDIDASGFAEKHGVRSDGMSDTQRTTQTTVTEPTLATVTAERDAAKAQVSRLDAELTAAKAALTKAQADLADVADAARKLRAANERADSASGKLATYESTLEQRIRQSAEMRVRSIMLLGPTMRFDGLGDDEIATMILRELTPHEPFATKDAEWRRVRVDELVKARLTNERERDTIARQVRGDADTTRDDARPKTKWGDQWKAGPPETTKMRNKERA